MIPAISLNPLFWPTATIAMIRQEYVTYSSSCLPSSWLPLPVWPPRTSCMWHPLPSRRPEQATPYMHSFSTAANSTKRSLNLWVQPPVNLSRSICTEPVIIHISLLWQQIHFETMTVIFKVNNLCAAIDSWCYKCCCVMIVMTTVWATSTRQCLCVLTLDSI